MINLQENFNRKNILIAAAVILVLVAAQLGLMRYVKSADTEVKTLKSETKTVDTALKSRTEAVMQYKTALRFDRGIVPDATDSPTIFYGNLVKMLSASGLSDAVVVKAGETEGLVSFKVSGKGQYFALLDALASFRQSANLIRLTDLTLTGGKDGAVTYGFTVQASVAKAAAPDGAKEGAAK